MDIMFLFYNQVENYLFYSFQADAMAPTFVHRWLLLSMAVTAWILLHSGYWVHTQLEPSGIYRTWHMGTFDTNELMNR